MARAALLLAQGFEEFEAMSLLTILARGGVSVRTYAVGGQKTVVGAHGVAMNADDLVENFKADEIEALVLPGGLPGAEHLRDDAGAQKAIKDAAAAGKYLAAVCAAPIALAAAGLTQDKAGTCYPGFEEGASFAETPPHLVVRDGKIVTSLGPCTAQFLGFELLGLLASGEAKKAVYEGMLYPLMRSREVKGHISFTKE